VPPLPLVAKRKLTETWREAVARRADDAAAAEEWTRVFDAHLAADKDEAEAAFLTLAAFEALSGVPDGPTPGRREPL
jgi:hypothetical protein